MTDKIIVFTTCGSEKEAARIARAVVEARLAACVNVLGGVRSHYRWKGSIEESSEWLLIIKSSRGRFPALRAALERAHSYELPEVIACSVVDGSEKYLGWLDRELGIL